MTNKKIGDKFKITKSQMASTLNYLPSLPKKKKKTSRQARIRTSTDPMRVAILCPYSMSIPGGVQNQVLLLSREMRTRGIDARIIAPCDGAPPVPYFQSVGTTSALKSNGSLAPIADDTGTASLTYDAVNSFRPDVIHLHEPLVPGPTVAAMIGLDYPLVATFHAAGEGMQTLKYLRHPARSATSRLHKRIAVSTEAKKRAIEFLPGDYTIIPNCVDIETIASAPKWPITKPAVLFIGRHEERKGLRYLIEGWLSSDELQKKADLWVAGVGPESDVLIDLSKSEKSISFLGRIENDELYRRMRASSVVVAPALHGESFGIVLLEAMAANSCVVATDIPGYRDVARSGVEAVLVEPGNSAALRLAIENILNDDILRKSLQRAGITRSQEFSVPKVVDKYIEIYKQAIGQEKLKSD